MHIDDEHEGEPMNSNERVLWTDGHGVLLLLMLAGIAFVTGYWAILLALGPATYLLVLDAHGSDNAPTKVAGSYGAALVIGWFAYMAIARGIAPTTVEPMSEPGLRRVGSTLVTFAGTTAIFYVLHTHQPMDLSQRLQQQLEHFRPSSRLSLR